MYDLHVNDHHRGKAGTLDLLVRDPFRELYPLPRIVLVEDEYGILFGGIGTKRTRAFDLPQVSAAELVG